MENKDLILSKEDIDEIEKTIEEEDKNWYLFDFWHLKDPACYDKLKKGYVVFKLTELIDWYSETDEDFLEIDFQRKVACLSENGHGRQPRIYGKLIKIEPEDKK